jgi:hypothetical protein
MQLVLFGAVNRRWAFFRHSQFAHSTLVLDRARGAHHRGARIGRAQVICAPTPRIIGSARPTPPLRWHPPTPAYLGWEGWPPASAALFSIPIADSVAVYVDSA